MHLLRTVGESGNQLYRRVFETSAQHSMRSVLRNLLFLLRQESEGHQSGGRFRSVVRRLHYCRCLHFRIPAAFQPELGGFCRHGNHSDRHYWDECERRSLINEKNVSVDGKDCRGELP